jgi:linoleate 10R-lipoxygenase
MAPLNVHAGDRLWISFKNANLDVSFTRMILESVFLKAIAMQPAQFPEPVEIDPRRQRTSYRILGNEFFSGPIAAFGEQIIVEVLRVILKLRNLRRAEGDLGRLAGFRTLVHETELNVYLMPDGSTSCWPGPLHLVVCASLLLVVKTLTRLPVRRIRATVHNTVV